MKENLKYIGANIRAARKNKNLTIDTLSELAGISESFLGTIERGESSLSVETLVSICEALNVSADSMLTAAVNTDSPIADKKDIILTLLRNSSDKELDFLIDYIKLYRNRIEF